MTDPQFAKVPRWIFQHDDLTRADVAVYAYLRWLASPGEECWPGFRQIAAGARVSRRTVADAIPRLEANGAIQILEVGKGRRASRYRVFHAPLNAVTVPQLILPLATASDPDSVPRSGAIEHQ